MPEVPAPADVPAETHPLLTAGKLIVTDLLSTLAFVGLFALTHSVLVATVLSILLGCAEIAYLTYRGRAIHPIQWMSFSLVVLFGGSAMLTNTPQIIQLKPSLIYALVGLFMLKPGWMNRYVPARAQLLAADVTTVFGFIWACLMLFTSLANTMLALYAPQAIWAQFIFIFPLASKVVLILIQYAVTRAIARRRARLMELSPGLKPA